MFNKALDLLLQLLNLRRGVRATICRAYRLGEQLCQVSRSARRRSMFERRTTSIATSRPAAWAKCGRKLRAFDQAARGIADVNAAWIEYRDLRTTIMEQESALARDRQEAELLTIRRSWSCAIRRWQAISRSRASWKAIGRLQATRRPWRTCASLPPER